ncbi:MAG TPA: hypothetical protein VHI93_08910, partial [Candidatus Thermoplasmatota archaeon]|nr:hypothetical protein [Candidatus Thermoplasmatota archaeon]
MRALPVLALALALAALPAAAQQHEHPAMGAAFIVHGMAPIVVGVPVAFAVVDDADGDLRPDVHRDNHIRVRLNGAV